MIARGPQRLRSLDARGASPNQQSRRAKRQERQSIEPCTSPVELTPNRKRALRALHELEAKLALVAKSVRLLPAITARNAPQERARLEADLSRGEMPCPRFVYAQPRPCQANLRWLDHLRAEAAQLPAAQLYLDKIEELELDVALLASLGDARSVRPLAARRFGTGEELVSPPGTGSLRLIDYSLLLLNGPSLRRREPPTIPASSEDGQLCLRGLIERVAKAAGLHVSVRVEPNLTAGAATGDHTVFLADRQFTLREAWRLAVHEVLGHLTAAENGSMQPLRLLEWGTGFSFADQEGVAISIEAAFGVLDRARLRALAGRVLATRAMHAGAAFGETARTLFRDYGFAAPEAIAISERAYRGGGVARDAGYLRGYLRVREAVANGSTSLDELRWGRVGLQALPELRNLLAEGLIHPPPQRPNLTRSFFSTSAGTVPLRLPPSAAASLISVELT